MYFVVPELRGDGVEVPRDVCVLAERLPDLGGGGRESTIAVSAVLPASLPEARSPGSDVPGATESAAPLGRSAPGREIEEDSGDWTPGDVAFVASAPFSLDSAASVPEPSGSRSDPFETMGRDGGSETSPDTERFEPLEEPVRGAFSEPAVEPVAPPPGGESTPRRTTPSVAGGRPGADEPAEVSTERGGTEPRGGTTVDRRGLPAVLVAPGVLRRDGLDDAAARGSLPGAVERRDEADDPGAIVLEAGARVPDALVEPRGAGSLETRRGGADVLVDADAGGVPELAVMDSAASSGSS